MWHFRSKVFKILISLKHYGFFVLLGLLQSHAAPMYTKMVPLPEHIVEIMGGAGGEARGWRGAASDG